MQFFKFILHVDYRLRITWIIHLQLCQCKVEKKLHLGVGEKKLLNTIVLDNRLRDGGEVVRLCAGRIPGKEWKGGWKALEVGLDWNTDRPARSLLRQWLRCPVESNLGTFVIKEIYRNPGKFQSLTDTAATLPSVNKHSADCLHYVV
jgi:hypothetical protein